MWNFQSVPKDFGHHHNHLCQAAYFETLKNLPRRSKKTTKIPKCDFETRLLTLNGACKDLYKKDTNHLYKKSLLLFTCDKQSNK